MTSESSAWAGYRVVWLRNGLAPDNLRVVVEQYCRRQDVRLAWVSLQTGDDDPLRFVQAVARAVESALEPRRQLVGGLEGIEPEAYWTALINRISADTRPLFLVLVGYGQIRHLRIHELVAELLEFQPPVLQILLDCQPDPPLPWPRLRARRALLEVSS